MKLQRAPLRRHRHWGLVAFTLLALLDRRPAAAGAPVQAARDLYEAGLRSYRAGAYDDAISKLEGSYGLVPAPELLYDLAQAHRLKGDCAQARALYRQFLDHAPEGPAGPLAQAHLAEMERCVATAAPAQASTPIIEAPAAVVRQPAMPVLAEAPRPDAGALDAVASFPPRSRFAGRRAELVAGAAAIGFAAAAGYFAWRSGQMSDQVSAMFVPGKQWTTAGTDAERSGHTDQTLAIASAVGALLSGGITFWLATHHR